MKTAWVALLGMGVAVLAGCATPEPAPDVMFTEGFPVALDAESFRPGDRLVYSVTSFDGDEATRFWIVFESLKATDPEVHEVELVLEDARGDPRETRTVASVMQPIRVSVFDAEKQEVDSDISEVARFVHESGLFAYARRHLRRAERAKLGATGPRMRTPPTLREARWGSGIFGQLVDAFADNDALQTLGGELSVSPTVFELPRFLGGSVTIYSGLRRAKVVAQPIPDLPVGDKALHCDLSVWRFGKPFLSVEVVYVEPVGPLAMTAGAVAFDGVRRDDRDRRFIARLVGMWRDAPRR